MSAHVAEPKVAIGAVGDTDRRAATGQIPLGSDDSGRRVAPDPLRGTDIGKPYVAITTHRDTRRNAAAGDARVFGCGPDREARHDGCRWAVAARVGGTDGDVQAMVDVARRHNI